jgi:hypothetical protein
MILWRLIDAGALLVRVPSKSRFSLMVICGIRAYSGEHDRHQRRG